MSAALSERTIACALAALAAFGFGVFAMLQAPQVPYADSWRFLVHFLSEPFPRSAFGMDNGHLELFPDLLRIAELHWMAANQRLQIGVGIALAVASWLVALRSLQRYSACSTQFWAGALVLALGLFWLGNFRALMHANETVHAYAVTLSLFLALSLAWRRGLVHAALAAGCAVFASLSFGSGLAVFPALMLVLALRRAAWREWLPLGLALAGVLTLMLGLRDGTAGGLGVPNSLQFLESLLRWLGGPPLYASWPLWDPQIAARIPVGAVRSILEPLGSAYSELAGPVLLARWPHLAWGLLGATTFAWALWRAWRLQRALSVFGVATAAFALIVGAMIVLVRIDYFQEHPDQLLAPRYLVWSSLLWAGLALVLVDTLKPAHAASAALLGCALLLPSQVWMHQLGLNQREVAERIALAAAVGVVEPDLPLGEIEFTDLAAALPLLLEAKTSVFAWPETQCLERMLAPGRLDWVETRGLRVRAVGNRLGAPGRRVEFDAPQVGAARLLLIDADGVARGLAQRERDGRWRGWMRGVGTEQDVRLAQVYGYCADLADRATPR